MNVDVDSVHRVVVEDDLYILPSYVLRQPADNSCLYHALACGLHRSFPHVSFDATTMRSKIDIFISSNPSFPSGYLPTAASIYDQLL